MTDLFEKSSADGFASQKIETASGTRGIGRSLKKLIEESEVYQQKEDVGNDFSGLTTGMRTADDARSHASLDTCHLKMPPLGRKDEIKIEPAGPSSINLPDVN